MRSSPSIDGGFTYLPLYGAVVNKLKTVLPRLMNRSSAPATFFAFEQPSRETRKFVNYERIGPSSAHKDRLCSRPGFSSQQSRNNGHNRRIGGNSTK
jgi:hypothetical protein